MTEISSPVRNMGKENETIAATMATRNHPTVAESGTGSVANSFVLSSVKGVPVFQFKSVINNEGESNECAIELAPFRQKGYCILVSNQNKIQK